MEEQWKEGSTEERWAPVVGSDTDEVSTLGRIRRGMREVKVTPTRQGSSLDGKAEYFYNRARIRLSTGKRRSATVGRVVLEAFVGPGKRGEYPIRRDGDPLNDCLSNLAWGRRTPGKRGEEGQCDRATSKYPNGRRGTRAGYDSHKRHKEEPCEECKEAFAAWQSEYNKKNAGKKREYQREWRELNRDLILERSRERGKEYYLRNKEASFQRSRERRARKRGAPSEPYSKEDIVELHGMICYLCEGEIVDQRVRSSDSFSFDHVVPISDDNGPGDVVANVRPAHLLCNVIKGDRPLERLSLPLPRPKHREWV